MGKIPIGLELYSVRNEAAADLPGVLEAVAKSGYEGVEFAGYYGWEAPAIRKLLDDNGLKCCGGHLGLNTLLGDELEKTVEFQSILGNDYLIVPGLGAEYTSSLDAWRKTADLFNEISAKLRPLGKWTGYHNHHTEFKPTDGTTPWDVFFGNTSADVIMQLDMGNGLCGNADLLGILRQYPGRGITVHLKPFKTGCEGHDGFKPLIGEDSVPWTEVFELLETTSGTQWAIVEYESDAYPSLEAVDLCLKNLRAMGK